MESPVSSSIARESSVAHAPGPGVAAAAGTAVDRCWGHGLWRWCLPALLIGLALRAALMWSMPYGYVQYDSSDYLLTTDRLIEDHHFYIHNKRSYLTPLLFSAAFLLPVPATVTIAAAQHVMGLIGTLIVGALVQLWFRFWRVAIIPVTVLFAASPWLIWYEHTIMGEAQYLFFTLAMILAATLFAGQPTWRRFVWFMVSLVLVSGTRLEAKAFYLFAFLLVAMVFWKQWRRVVLGLASVLATYALAFHLSGDRDVSALVYASLIRFAPASSRSVPDIMRRIIPIQQAARAESPDYPANLVRLSKQINHAVDDYVTAHVPDRKKQGEEEARIVRDLCLETLVAEPWQTLLTPWTKFHLAIDAWSSYCFDRESLRGRQRDAYTMKDWMTLVLGRGLTGQPLTIEQVPDWLQTHFSAGRVAWFAGYQTAWNDVFVSLRLPDKPMASVRWVHDFYGGVPGKDWQHTLPGMPLVYIAGFCGMILSIFRPSRFRPLHLAWVVTMLAGLYLASMAGVTNARFRFVYEPFVLVYLFLLFDGIAGFSRAVRNHTQAPTPCST